jgi:putative ABC transport system permease protein
MHRTPLALLNLIHDRKKFLTSLAGVAFAVLLMFLFNGFKNALYDSQTQLLEGSTRNCHHQPAERKYVCARAFARRRLYQAQAFEGVEDAYAVYTARPVGKIPTPSRPSGAGDCLQSR